MPEEARHTRKEVLYPLFKMNTPKDLTIASLVLGGVGALLFIIYKVRGGKKSSLMANGSKVLIAIGIILLAIAVLLLSEDKN